MEINCTYSMIEIIVKQGRLKCTVFLTILAIIFSVTLDLFVKYYNHIIVSWGNIMNAVIAPAIFSPIVSFYIFGLIIKIHKLEGTQRYLATYDMLTGLMSRRPFFTSFTSIIKLMQRNNSVLSLAYIDIDNFKLINDTYGHAAGDEVLKSFSTIIKNNLRESDLVGRIGGEEFAIVLPNTELKNAANVLKKIQIQCVNKKVIYCDQNISYTVSIGISLYDQNNLVEIEQLFRQADDALYKAKKLEKNCIFDFKGNRLF